MSLPAAAEPGEIDESSEMKGDSEEVEIGEEPEPEAEEARSEVESKVTNGEKELRRMVQGFQIRSRSPTSKLISEKEMKKEKRIQGVKRNPSPTSASPIKESQFPVQVFWKRNRTVSNSNSRQFHRKFPSRSTTHHDWFASSSSRLARISSRGASSRFTPISSRGVSSSSFSSRLASSRFAPISSRGASSSSSRFTPSRGVSSSSSHISKRQPSPRRRQASRSPPRRRQASQSPSRRRQGSRSPPRRRQTSRSPPRRRQASRSLPRKDQESSSTSFRVLTLRTGQAFKAFPHSSSSRLQPRNPISNQTPSRNSISPRTPSRKPNSNRGERGEEGGGGGGGGKGRKSFNYIKHFLVENKLLVSSDPWQFDLNCPHMIRSFFVHAAYPGEFYFRKLIEKVIEYFKTSTQFDCPSRNVTYFMIALPHLTHAGHLPSSFTFPSEYCHKCNENRLSLDNVKFESQITRFMQQSQTACSCFPSRNEQCLGIVVHFRRNILEPLRLKLGQLQFRGLESLVRSSS